MRQAVGIRRAWPDTSAWEGHERVVGHARLAAEADVLATDVYCDAWKPTRAAAGRKKVTFHDLRHIAAGLLLPHPVAELAEPKSRPGKAKVARKPGQAPIAHSVDPARPPRPPGRLKGLRVTFDAAVSAAHQHPAPTPPAEAGQRPRLSLVT